MMLPRLSARVVIGHLAPRAEAGSFRRAPMNHASRIVGKKKQLILFQLHLAVFCASASVSLKMQRAALSGDALRSRGAKRPHL